MVAHVLGVPRQRRHGRGAAAWAAASAARRRRATCSPRSPRWSPKKTGRAGQDPARPRRRHGHDRQAPRLRASTTTSASTTRAASRASTSTTPRAAATPPTCRGPVTDRALFHADNCLLLSEHVAARARCRCKTNTVSNTAFRGFGGPQGMVAVERMIEEIAYALGQGSARGPQGATSTARASATSRPTTRRSRTTSSPRSSPSSSASADYRRAARGDRAPSTRAARCSSAASR